MKIAVIPAVLAASIVCAPLAHANGSQQSLTDAVRQVYNQVQRRCTPSTPPQFQSISVDGQGHGRIIDSNPSLGGPFNYLWGANGSPGVPGAQYHVVPADDGNGIWYLDLEFC